MPGRKKIDGVEILGRLARMNGHDVVLLTASEVGRVLGVSRQRVYELARVHEGDFPKPATVEKGVRLWRRSSIDEWKAQWDRKPGRPPK